MRTRRLRPLSVSALDSLPLWHCRTTLVGSDADPTPAWAVAAADRFGSCGMGAYDNDELVGWVVYCPTLNVPADHRLAQGTRVAESAVLLAVAVRDNHRGQGIGRQLVQAAAAHMVGGATCVDALGAAVPLTCEVAPLYWLSAVGFAPVDAHHVGPGPVRMRLDLGATIRWRPDLRSAVNLLTGWVPRPGVVQEPARRVLHEHSGGRA